MKLFFALGGCLHTIETPAIEVVRLVAGAKRLGPVDMEPFPDYVRVEAGDVRVKGETQEAAAEAFLRRVLA